MKVLQIGAGSRPLEGATNHDRIKHSEWIDVEHDLNVLPWAWEDESWDVIYALDVLEHLTIEVVDWMRELKRILVVDGYAIVRLPAWDHDLSYRDPTHRKVFHHETLDFFDPSKELYSMFGRYYWDNTPTFNVEYLGRENNDFKWKLTKLKG